MYIYIIEYVIHRLPLPRPIPIPPALPLPRPLAIPTPPPIPLAPAFAEVVLTLSSTKSASKFNESGRSHARIVFPRMESVAYETGFLPRLFYCLQCVVVVVIHSNTIKK